MHLQQTKVRSRVSGGPQYYLQDLTEGVATYLRKKKAVPVALVTPYGATPSHFFAVSKDAKLKGGKVVRGRVEHDRIQQAKAGQSIGEAIRDWYKLPQGTDFERIDIEMPIHDDKFYLTPTAYRLRKKSRSKVIQRPEYPLSFNRHMQSQLWKEQLKHVETSNVRAFKWALAEIARVVSAHQPPGTAHVLEPDILRASGSLSILGVKLGPYLGKGFDCKKSRFQFLSYEPYEVAVEIKKKSSGFKYQQQKYSKEELSRAVVLCVTHNLVNVPHNVDVIELSCLAQAGGLRL